MIGSMFKKLIRSDQRRLKPSLLIIGAQKAGTSALFNMLAAHQLIEVPETKELHFFNGDWPVEDLSEYWNLFPVGRSKDSLTLEATPNYLSHPHAAERIKETLPDVKMVVVLRDPVTRAYSAWNMFRDFEGHASFDHLYDDRTFEEAVVQEINGEDVAEHKRYLRKGHYAEQLQVYFRYFPRDVFHIVPYSLFKEKPGKVVNDICRFIGIEEMDLSDPVFNERKNVRPYQTSMDTDIRERLKEYFAPHDRALRSLLGEDFTY